MIEVEGEYEELGSTDVIDNDKDVIDNDKVKVKVKSLIEAGGAEGEAVHTTWITWTLAPPSCPAPRPSWTPWWTAE